MSSRLLSRLVRRLREEHDLDLEDDLSMFRTRAGRHQRAAGAWAWFVLDSKNREVLASQYPISELVKAPKLTVYRDYRYFGAPLEIDPAYEES